MQTVDRLVRLIEILAASRQGRHLSDLAEDMHLSKSTVHRLLSALQDHVLVRQDRETKRYLLGFGFLRLSQQFLTNLDIRAVALPHLRRLRDGTGEAVFLTQVEGEEAICVETIESPGGVALVVQVGRQVSLHSMAAGKAILAFRPQVEVEAMVAKMDLQPFTSRTIRDKESLLRELDVIRNDGYALCDEEFRPGVRAVAAPVFNVDGYTLGSVTALGVSNRLVGDSLQRLAQAVVTTAAELSQDIAGTAGVPHTL